MNLNPKTIQIFLPGGEARGIRVAEITTRIVQVIEVPRSLLSDFLKMPESEQVAVYFLVGDSEESATKAVYVGQTGDLRTRLSAHHKEKDFWDRALVLISRTNSLTQTHALFLEWHCLQSVKKAARYLDQNNNNGSKPHTPAPLAADCLEIFETGEVLLATLGYPLFESVARLSGSAKKDELFYCTASDAKGLGLYTPEGFVVLKGSTGRKECVPSFAGTSWHRLRLQLVKDGVMREDGDQVVFERDHLFKTPSMAAAFVMARSANGWTSWKNEAGKTLDAVYR